MDSKKLFILGIDNIPEVWYNEGRDCAESRFFGIFAEKNFVQIAYWQNCWDMI